MELRDNYQIQARQAKTVFLSRDQQALIGKLKLQADEDYLYTALFSCPYRIHRQTGDLQRLQAGAWVDANSHSEVMTLLDLVCDSRPDRCLPTGGRIWCPSAICSTASSRSRIPGLCVLTQIRRA